MTISVEEQKVRSDMREQQRKNHIKRQKCSVFCNDKIKTALSQLWFLCLMLVLVKPHVTYPSSSGLHPHKSTEESLWAVWLNPEGGWCRELTEPVWKTSQGKSHDEDELFIEYQSSTHCVYSLLTFLLGFCLFEKQIQISFRKVNKNEAFCLFCLFNNNLPYCVYCMLCSDSSTPIWRWVRLMKLLLPDTNTPQTAPWPPGKWRNQKSQKESTQRQRQLSAAAAEKPGRRKISEYQRGRKNIFKTKCCLNFSCVFSYLKVYTQMFKYT